MLVPEHSYDLGLGNFANKDCKNKIMMENTLSCEGGVKATTSYDSRSPSLGCLSSFIAMINGFVSMIVVFKLFVEEFVFRVTNDYPIK